MTRLLESRAGACCEESGSDFAVEPEERGGVARGRVWGEGEGDVDRARGEEQQRGEGCAGVFE